MKGILIFYCEFQFTIKSNHVQLSEMVEQCAVCS